ncbi:hypothetical protein QR680_014765 [Steinernema hermaphroditum]|uniref:Uncharacterized protein n=1 Tax=Steinernema hermaphroditum TaxID=289476 RepID=A0AA39IBH6_9BILA|nr:hypothetical protein QR680_014765 [Steinernema hermaphroditum]
MNCLPQTLRYDKPGKAILAFVYSSRVRPGTGITRKRREINARPRKRHEVHGSDNQRASSVKNESQGSFIFKLQRRKESTTKKGKDEASVVITICTKLFIFLRRRPSDVDVETKKIVRALFVIVTFYVFGYGATMYLWVTSRILFTDVNLVQAVEFYISMFAGVNINVPCVIYYTQSIVYKTEIRRFLGLSPPTQVQVAVMSSTT